MPAGNFVRIALSPIFKKFFEDQTKLVSAARTMLDRYSEWLSFSGIPFFPEYTDHGVNHLSSVIATAESLLSEETRSLLTSSDAAVFVMAVVLHDIAMHMTESGFVRLVRGETKLIPVREFGDKSWPALWDDFQTEAVRFSREQNIELFGDPKPVPWPALDDTDWTKKQRMLIGEFIRRHHPQLAHQIALYGFPGKGSEVFDMIDSLAVRERNLVGLVARSHGVSLRPCIDYLEKEFFNRIAPLGIYAVFSMCLIRTADYFQIEASRSSYHLSIQSIRSPRSLLEHSKHQAVVELTRDAEDNESLRAIVDPAQLQSVRVYLDLKNLLDDIQRSLDTSWAILGEVYSRQSERKLNQLGMNVRRLRSNLETPAFLQKIDFVPVHFRFTASEARLFKLLLHPLYGNDPNIGVREMAQNAIDAVRERQKYVANHGLPPLPDGIDVEVSVEELEPGQGYVVINDRGIGMTLDVVQDFFLKVGSSLRQSKLWKKEFTNEEQQSLVLRTGYFGIGALAAFLIGDEIEVVTRHVTDEQGLHFRATIDTDPIQVSRVDASIGTKIRVKQRDNDGWTPHFRFFLKSPVVHVMGRGPDVFYPDAADPVTPEWQEVPHLKQPLVRWARPNDIFVNRVTLNGFEIEHGDQRLRALWSNRFYGLQILCPHLHILDYEGSRERSNYINLARNMFFQDQFEPLPEVAVDVLRDAMAFLLTVPAQVLKKDPGQRVNGHRKWWDHGLINLQLTKLNQGFVHDAVRAAFWAFTSRGLVPCDGAVFTELGIETLLFSSVWHPSLIPEDPDSALILVMGPKDDLQTLGNSPGNFVPLSMHVTLAKCVVYRRGVQAMTASWGDESTALSARLEQLDERLRTIGVEAEPFIGAWALGKRAEANTDDFLAEIARQMIVAFEGKAEEPSPILAVWDGLLHSWVVPYDESVRRERFPDAYDALKPYLDAWENLNA